MSVENIKQYLEQEIKQTYRDICEEWKSVKQLLVEVEAKEAELKQKIIKEAGGERLEHGVKVSIIEVRGSIKYKDIPEVKALDANYLDAFRGADRKDFRVTTY